MARDPESDVRPHPSLSVEGCGNACPYTTNYVETLSPMKLRTTGVEGLLGSLSAKLYSALPRAVGLLPGWVLSPEAAWGARLLLHEVPMLVPAFVASLIVATRDLAANCPDREFARLEYDEAENLRMHLLVLQHITPELGPLARGAAAWATVLAMPGYALGYLLLPRASHAAVAQLNEALVGELGAAVAAIDRTGDGPLAWMLAPAPGFARDYWKLPSGTTVRDVLVRMRADAGARAALNAAAVPGQPNHALQAMLEPCGLRAAMPTTPDKAAPVAGPARGPFAASRPGLRSGVAGGDGGGGGDSAYTTPSRMLPPLATLPSARSSSAGSEAGDAAPTAAAMGEAQAQAASMGTSVRSKPSSVPSAPSQREPRDVRAPIVAGRDAGRAREVPPRGALFGSRAPHQRAPNLAPPQPQPQAKALPPPPVDPVALFEKHWA